MLITTTRQLQRVARCVGTRLCSQRLLNLSASAFDDAITEKVKRRVEDGPSLQDFVKSSLNVDLRDDVEIGRPHPYLMDSDIEGRNRNGENSYALKLKDCSNRQFYAMHTQCTSRHTGAP